MLLRPGLLEWPLWKVGEQVVQIYKNSLNRAMGRTETSVLEVLGCPKGCGPCVSGSLNRRPAASLSTHPPCFPPELWRWGRMGSRCFTLMKWRISKCYLRKHMVCPSKRPPSAAAATNTFLYSAQTSPRGIRNNCGDKSACR